MRHHMSAGGALEPVLLRVVISHAWPILEGGLVVMDLPAVSDAETARGNLVSLALTTCHSVMVVARIDRWVPYCCVHHIIACNTKAIMFLSECQRRERLFYGGLACFRQNTY